MQVMCICAAIYNIFNGMPTLRGPSVTASLLVIVHNPENLGNLVSFISVSVNLDYCQICKFYSLVQQFHQVINEKIVAHFLQWISSLGIVNSQTPANASNNDIQVACDLQTNLQITVINSKKHIKMSCSNIQQ